MRQNATILLTSKRSFSTLILLPFLFYCFWKMNSPKTPKSNANARAAQLLTQTGQIGAYILRSAFSVGCSKAHSADSDCSNRCVNFMHRFSGYRRQLCGANCENSNKSESENVTAARVNFSREFLALKTRNFVNDVDQRS